MAMKCAHDPRIVKILSGMLFGMSYIPTTLADIPACSQSLKERLLITSPGDFANITSGNCKLDFSASDILKPLRITGNQASGLQLNCNGAKIIRKPGSALTTVLNIQSSYNLDYLEQQMLMVYEAGHGTATSPYGVSRPANIDINGCTIVGAIAVSGVGGNPALISSRSQLDLYNYEHTFRMRAMAPTNIKLNGLHVYADPNLNIKTLLHLHSGVTKVTISNSTFTGQISDVTLYMSPESAWNTIKNNIFNVAPLNDRKREIIAIDASVRNTITGNAFKNIQKGGIHLYRNCGENGLTRHQPPKDNQIFNNDFFYLKSTTEALWVNKRTAAPIIADSNVPLIHMQTYCQSDEKPKSVTLNNGAVITLNRSKNKLGSAADTFKLALEAYGFKLTDLLVNHDGSFGNQIYKNYLLNYGQYHLIHDGIPVPPVYKRIDKYKNAVKYPGSDYKNAAIKFSGLNVEENNSQNSNVILAYPKENCTPTPAPFVFEDVTRQVVYSSEDQQCYILPTVGN